MAGTIQTLILTPSPTKSLLFRHRNLHFPAKHAILRCHFISSRRSRLTWRSIRACESSNQIESDGENLDRESGSVEGLLWARPLLNFASDNFLPLALLGGVALGLANPGLGCLADKYSLSKFSTFGIFIVSGLTLRSEDIGDAAEAWPVAILGLVSILLFTPYFSRLILHFRLQPQEFVTGLAIFCCMPTTLSSGVALTQLAGGNSALALAMTVISNLLGILIIPFSISRFIASGVGVSVPTKQLLKSLVVTLLIPLVLGKPPVRFTYARRKRHHESRVAVETQVVAEVEGSIRGENEEEAESAGVVKHFPGMTRRTDDREKEKTEGTREEFSRELEEVREELKKIPRLEQGMDWLLARMEELMKLQRQERRDAQTAGVEAPTRHMTPGEETSERARPPRKSGFRMDCRTRRVEMLTFDGENPDGWVFRAERYFVMNRLSENEKLDVVVVSIGDFVDQNRKLFSKISAILLSLVPWMQVSRSRSLLLMVKPAVFLVAIGAGALLHLILLAFNVLTIKSLSALSGGGQSVFAKKENSSAFLLVASQKTLPVMVAVVEKLGGAFGESGLLVLPCVAAHLNQVTYVSPLLFPLFVNDCFINEGEKIIRLCVSYDN
ncbi:hypothetical protein L484_018339 [Morus notabilis]|uniref:Sodium/metabolite cotransporter BASS4 n=1 Tax=Morus notabilis TaxID=981085 RepID=W9R2E2_9ROSA|nr:hypothetical protein L484_018339 [Morus notabilis]